MSADISMVTAALAAHRAICEDSWGECSKDRDGNCWRAAEAAVPAYLATLTTEFAGDHKHADIELTDEDGDPFEDEAHAVRNFADYPNATVVWRKITPWEPVEVTP